MLLLILILSTYSKNHYCSDANCSTCLQGYSYRSVSCVTICPEQSYLNALNICSYSFKGDICKVQFFKFFNYDSSSIDVFYHPQNLPFQDSGRQSPIPTNDRGFYFTTTSTLKTNKHWVIGPTFMIDLIARVRNDGTILNITSALGINFHLYSVSNVLHAQLLLFHNFSSSLYEFTNTFTQEKWLR